MQFEDFEFWAPAEYDKILRRMFGTKPEVTKEAENSVMIAMEKLSAA